MKSLIKKKKLLVLAACAYFLLHANQALTQGRFLVSGDVEYFTTDITTNIGAYRLIYPAEYRPLIASLSKYNNLFKNIYEKEFNWLLDEKETIILASSQNQLANGFATIFPRLHTAFYGNGADAVDEMSAQSWLYTLLSHETSHLYQLNTKLGYSKLLKSVFGNSNIDGSAFLPPFTYVMNPNVFLPTFILEGNATYNENRFGNGGRLYNGAIRAMLLQLIKENKITADRLMNDHLEFPYTREKYWVGGFLFLDLAEKSTDNSVNRFFLAHANNNFNPFQLNEPFIKTYGVSYKEALANLTHTWATLANTIVSANEKPIFTSSTHAPITKNTNEILFLTSSNKNLPIAHIYDLRNKKWSEQKVNMPMGRLFRNSRNELISTSSEQIKNNQLRAGLFGEGYSFNENDLDKNYYDLASETIALWADAKNSFYSPQLFFQNSKTSEATPLGHAASSGIIRDSHSYFFRQNKKTRTLYRDNSSLFSYQGYYGYPVDVANDDIYFIGPVERGSSLFVWSNGQFSRLHSSDIIIDAKLLNNQTALIVEFTTHGYDYKIVQLERKKNQHEIPFEYKYFFENDKLFKTFDDLNLPTDKSISLASNVTTSVPLDEIDEKPYSSLSEWQFDGVDPMLFFGIDTFAVGQATIRFSDPLQDHQIGLILGSGSFGETTTGLQYMNTKNVINWDVLGLYQRRAKVTEDFTYKSSDPNHWQILDRYDAWQAAVGFNYLFYKRPQWFSTLSGHFIYEYETPAVPVSDIDQKYTWLTQFALDYRISPPLAYQSYKVFSFNLDHEYVRSAPDWVDPRNILGAQVKGSYDLLKETYLSVKYQSAITDGSQPSVPFAVFGGDFPYATVTRVNRNTSYLDENFFGLSKASANLTQAINWGYYFTRFPISIRRFALLAEYNEYYGSTIHKSYSTTLADMLSMPQLFHEVGGGIDIEFLLFHRFPVRTQLVHYKSSYQNESATLFTLGREF